jgi:hypothetical protein
MRWVSGAWADLALAIGSRRIEVAQHDGADCPGRGHVRQQVLHRQLGAAIDVDRVRRFGFLDRQRLGHPVDRAGAGEHDRRDTATAHGRDQGDRAPHVVVVVFERLAGGFAHQRRGGEVQDGGHPVALHHAGNQVLVAHVADLQRPPFDRLAVAGRQIVERDRHEVRPVQRLADVAADIAGAAGHQHGWSVSHASPRASRPAPRKISRFLRKQ